MKHFDMKCYVFSNESLSKYALILIIKASCDMLPNSGEILYAIDSGISTMTWCYPQPRILTAVSVTPVPFNLPQEFEAKNIDESLKVSSPKQTVIYLIINKFTGK